MYITTWLSMDICLTVLDFIKCITWPIYSFTLSVVWHFKILQDWTNHKFGWSISLLINKLIQTYMILTTVLFSVCLNQATRPKKPPASYSHNKDEQYISRVYGKAVYQAQRRSLKTGPYLRYATEHTPNKSPNRPAPVVHTRGRWDGRGWVGGVSMVKQFIRQRDGLSKMDLIWDML